MAIEQELLLDLSQEIGDVFIKIGNDDFIATQRLLHYRIKNPQSYVTVVGETSSGKSTIINGLYNEELLPTSTKPTTGTVTQIINDVSRDSNEYFAINKDGTYEPLKYELYNELSLKPDRNLLRLQVQKSQKEKLLDGLNIFDTPGYNSLVAEHELILRTFLPESDVIIFTVLYRNGFTLDDQFLLSSIVDLRSDPFITVKFPVPIASE